MPQRRVTFINSETPIFYDFLCYAMENLSLSEMTDSDQVVAAEGHSVATDSNSRDASLIRSKSSSSTTAYSESSSYISTYYGIAICDGRLVESLLEHIITLVDETIARVVLWKVRRQILDTKRLDTLILEPKHLDSVLKNLVRLMEFTR